MLSYLCHERVLLHACGRRGVASTLSTRKGTHFFADMQEKSHFSAILFRATMGVEDIYPEFQCQSVRVRGTSILPLIALIYTDMLRICANP